jgi:hypothetical protein
MLLVLALVQVSRSRVRFAGAVLALQALTIAPVLMATSPERLLFAARAAPAFVAWKSYLFLRLLWSGAPGVTKR